MEEMDKELIETTKQQIEEKIGQVNQITEQIKQLTEQVDQFAIQVNQVALQVNQLMEDVKQICPGQVKQQTRERDTLFTKEVELFTEQCLRCLEIGEDIDRGNIGVSVAVLYRLHEVWCEIHGVRCMTRKAFMMSMKSLGYCKVKGKCLVKSCAAGQVKDRLQIFFHYVPRIEDMTLQKQIKEKLHEKLTEGYWGLNSSEYQQLYALFVWFDE